MVVKTHQIHVCMHQLLIIFIETYQLLLFLSEGLYHPRTGQVVIYPAVQGTPRPVAAGKIVEECRSHFVTGKQHHRYPDKHRHGELPIHPEHDRSRSHQ